MEEAEKGERKKWKKKKRKKEERKGQATFGGLGGVFFWRKREENGWKGKALMERATARRRP